MRYIQIALMTDKPMPPMRAAILPVPPLQQNCSLIWCTKTMKAALTDPGGDLDKLKAGVEKAGVTLEKILITHGHLDHCGQAGMLADELGLPIEGPHKDDIFWIEQLDNDGARYGMTAKSFTPTRWLEHGDTVTVGELTLDSIARATRRATWSSCINPAALPLLAMCCSRARLGGRTFRAAIIRI